jgi:hypothetical protein
LWLYIDRATLADDELAQGGGARAHQRPDTPPGPPHDMNSDEDFGSSGLPPRGPDGDQPQGSHDGGGQVLPPGAMPPQGIGGGQALPPGAMPPQGIGGGQALPPGAMPPRGVRGVPATPTMPTSPGMIPGLGGHGRAIPFVDPDSMKEALLDQRTQELAEQFRRVGEAERPEIKKQIEKAVAEQFEIRQDRRKKELKNFEDEIKKLRDVIEKREKARADIIERRIKELLGQDDDLRF